MPTLTNPEKASYDAAVTKIAGLPTGAELAMQQDAQDAATATVASDLAGHVGAGSSLAHPDASDSTSGFMPAAAFTKLDGIEPGAQVCSEGNVRTALAALTADPSINGRSIVGAVTGPGADSLATRGFVEGIAQGLSLKGSVDVATTGDITLSGEQTIDGVLTSSSRVLVKEQSSPVQNGIYRSGAGAWVREDDLDVADQAAAAHCFVQRGSTLADTQWVCTNDTGSDLVGTDPLTWTQFGAGGMGFASTAQAISDSSNSGGIASTASRSDHVHAHGNRGGGSLHAAVVDGGDSGFMTGAQATKLAGIEAGAQVTSEAHVRTALAALTADPSFNNSKLTGVAAGNAATHAMTCGQPGIVWVWGVSSAPGTTSMRWVNSGNHAAAASSVLAVSQVPTYGRTLTGMIISLGLTLDDAITVTVQVNGVDVAIADTVPTGSTATRLVSGFSVPTLDGDLVSVKLVAAGNSAKANIFMHVTVLGGRT